MKAMAFIKANSANPVSIPDIVACTGMSGRYLEKAFRKILGQTIVGALQAERIKNAKTLLLETNLGITRIALESGFGDYPSFAKVFRKKVGLTPSDFRFRAMKLKEMPPPYGVPSDIEGRDEWYGDSFPGNLLNSNWQARQGMWRNENGSMCSEGANNRVAFLKPLPENCRVQFEAQVESFRGLGFPSFSVFLVADDPGQIHSEFSTAAGSKAAGVVRHFLHGDRWNPAARMELNHWHKIALEIRDNSFHFTIDSKEAFSFRDSFPPAYSSRCFLQLGTFHATVKIRKFSIQNLGFMPVTHPIRQGDVLYNAELYEKAMDFYLRFLQSGSAGDAETMELRYKIGMCCLRQKAFTACQSWIDKVVALREEPFWAQQARIALLELYWKAADLDNLRSHLRLCMADQSIADSARVLVQLAINDFQRRGFWGEARLLAEEWFSLEHEKAYGHSLAGIVLSECLGNMRQFGCAATLLESIANTSPFEEFVFNALISQMQLCHEWGQFEQSESLRAHIEEITRDPFSLARCMLQQAANLRAKEEFSRALDILALIADKYPFEANFTGHAKFQSAFILCCMGRLVEGGNAIAEARNSGPPIYPDSRQYLPFLIAERDFTGAAELFLNEYRYRTAQDSFSAELGVKAGILNELADKREEAKSIFKEVSQRFPDEQVRYFGLLAGALMGEKKPPILRQAQDERGIEPADHFEKNNTGVPESIQLITEMPYEHFRRSEMFYLIGLLMKKRGDNSAAHALFELSMKDDPALRWPAWFSKQKLR